MHVITCFYFESMTQENVLTSDVETSRAVGGDAEDLMGCLAVSEQKTVSSSVKFWSCSGKLPEKRFILFVLTRPAPPSPGSAHIRLNSRSRTCSCRRVPCNGERPAREVNGLSR